jgi:hypothetical protein
LSCFTHPHYLLQPQVVELGLHVVLGQVDLLRRIARLAPAVPGTATLLAMMSRTARSG